MGSKRPKMKKTIALIMVAALWLAGCSSRDDAESIADGSDLEIGAALQVPAGQVRIFSDTPSLLTGDANRALITAVVTDESNRALAEQEVIFSSDAVSYTHLTLPTILLV